ncbi:MAG: AI-2E family transporter, partial [Parvibaculum sp.]|nr:AI-2E family transporter [Parvibaculum sp.]
MSIQRQAIIWAAVIGIFILMLWLLKGILLPFVAGMAIAYFLDPLADKLEEYGLSRIAATGMITVAFLLVAVILAIVLIPVLYNQ